MKNKAVWFLVGVILALMPGACVSPVGNELKDGQWTDTRKVYIRQSGNKFELIRNGNVFYIKGASGNGDYLPELAAAGGNCIRIYSHECAGQILDEAQSLGLAVIMDLPVPKVRHGFDFDNDQDIDSLTTEILSIVEAYKNHPALLIWCLGNEYDLQNTNVVRPWKRLNTIAKKMHQADPDHPIVSALHEGPPERYEKVLNLCPELDALALNLFVEVKEIEEAWKKVKMDRPRPYLLSEWAPKGTWQSAQTAWESPVESNAWQKAYEYQWVFEHIVRKDTLNCLGSCVFFWGQKQERTHTWYSIFSEFGRKTDLTDALAKVWSGEMPENPAPVVQSITLDGFGSDSVAFLRAGQMYTGRITGYDLDNDSLFCSWEILKEGKYRATFGGEKETKPVHLDSLVVEQHENWIRFRAPAASGPYRLYGYIEDAQLGISSSNIPVFVVHARPEDFLAK